MNKKSHANRRAFALIELGIVILMLSLLVLLLIPALAKHKNKSQRIRCTNNLKQVGISFRLFGTDHGDRYPSVDLRDGTNVAARIFQVMSNDLRTPNKLTCPSDLHHPAKSWVTLADTNISYFAALDADATRPSFLLAGDRNLATNGVPVKPGIVEIKPSDQLSWTRALHRGVGNAALADGSVQSKLGGPWGISGRLAVP